MGSTYYLAEVIYPAKNIYHKFHSQYPSQMRKLKLNSFWSDLFGLYRSSLRHHAPTLQPHNNHSGSVLVSMQLKAVQINPDYTTHPTHRNSMHLTIFTCRSLLPP